MGKGGGVVVARLRRVEEIWRQVEGGGWGTGRWRRGMELKREVESGCWSLVEEVSETLLANQN